MAGVGSSLGCEVSGRGDALRAGKKKGMGVNVFSKKMGRQTCLRECREGTQRWLLLEQKQAGWAGPLT